ncbi:DUF4168 domain-containing protein [Halomonas binhaiensis]|uniref:DUF4168 domain-containing protein n=1 Tax=Halomonas binhaiensis TaxID=2562282 RepID=A0A5C1NGE7_9GAMM|nr:DUF4168 domain-containing protein [Halomonas binhaiensis]QEM81285.1 DUF4168 domain-containing protein [Halomonas binhaiensis]
MRQGITTLLTAAVLSIGLMSATAHAQEAGSALTQAQAPAANFTDEQLQQFVDASRELRGLIEEYNPRIQQAPSDAEKQSLMQEANNKMVGVVESKGLDANTYGAIGNAVQSDPELANRVKELAQGTN